MAGDGQGSRPGWSARIRDKAVIKVPTQERVDAEACSAHLASLGPDGEAARRLDAAVDRLMVEVVSLSSLTAPLAVDYLERMRRPLPALAADMGVQIVGRAYLAHMVVEHDPGLYRATDIPVLGTLPPLKKGRPPQDLLSRAVKASRRGFETVCALPIHVWDGFAYLLARRVHDMAAAAGAARSEPVEYVALAAVDGLARFGWVLRQVDLHYGLDPERTAGPH